MTGSPFKDCVAIDTNVFVHLLDTKGSNKDKHVSQFLSYLQNQKVGLVVDDKQRITGEYTQQISPAILSADDTGNEAYILRYWILDAPRELVPLAMNDRLMTGIRKVIIEPSENVDRILVYVALKSGNVLVSNDEMHIIRGPTIEQQKGPRCRRLLRGTRKLRPAGADILTSREAHAKCPKQP